jgi:hypothetical protein
MLFKKGDIIKPKKFRHSSNYYNFKNLKTLKVIETYSKGWYEKFAKVKAVILEGKSYNRENCMTSTEGDHITLFIDSIEKTTYHLNPVYEVW